MKLKYIFAIAAAATLFASCSGYLDQDNRSNVSASDFYNTSSGFESLTNSMYSTLRTIYNISPLTMTAGTDLFGDGKTQGVNMNYYQHTPTEGNVLTLYTNFFKSIQMANSVIYYGNTTEETSVKQQYIDEARFVRAWDYFMLVQLYGKVALVTDMFSSPVMSFERTDLKSVYDFIISEFEYLANESSLLTRDESGVGRANKRAAAFFLAKAYLTRGYLNGQDYESQEENIAQSTDFQNAAKYALVAINNETPSISIEDAFNVENEDNSEIFWSVQFAPGSFSDPSSEGSYQQAQFGSYLGGAEYPKTKAIDGNESPFLRLLQMYTRGDGRLEQTFMLELRGTSTSQIDSYFDYYNNPTTTPIIVYYAPAWATDDDIAAWQADDPYNLKTNAIISKTVADGGIAPSQGKAETWTVRRSEDCGVPCIKKFDDYTEESMANRSTSCSTHDVVVSRLGEAYLIAAEAYVQMGDNASAANMINQLRQRPGTVKEGYEESMTVSADDMSIDFILDERAREMAGEYVRWFDLKRTHKLVEYVTKYNEDGVTEDMMKGSDGNYKILRPIPQDAIDKNQATVEQNPGY
jgi:hypothetical protein